MPVISFLNQKGGVGKTSTCYHLAGALTQMGRRVLLVDNDPQASLTQGFIGPEGMVALAPGETIVSVYAGDEPFPGQVIRQVLPGLDLLPGSDLATSYNLPDPHRLGREAQGCVRDFLSDVRGRYDFVLIDCPPNLCLCSWAALVASDALVVPLQPEDFGAQGIPKVRDAVDQVRAASNPGLSLAGYLITRVGPRKSLHRMYEARLRELYGTDVFAATVPDAVDYPEAVAVRKPVSLYKPRGAAAKAVRALAEELEARVAVRRVA